MLRRDLLTASGLLLAGMAVSPLPNQRAMAAGEVDHKLLQSLQACTPMDSLKRLMDGNQRFAKAWTAASAADTPEQRMHQLNTIWEQNCQIDPTALAKGQKPFAAILSCADSREDPGWVFACGSGELFQVRSAGNTAFNEGIASMEYAVSVLQVPLILVLGHSGCGAVKAAMASNPLTPLLEDLVKPIRASIKPGEDLTQAIKDNVVSAAATLTARSEVLRDAASTGKVKIRGAFFDIGSGLVTLL
jgi:carbonic anhydrase